MYQVYFTDKEKDSTVLLSVFPNQEQAISFAASLHLTCLVQPHQVVINFEDDKGNVSEVCVLVTI